MYVRLHCIKPIAITDDQAKYVYFRAHETVQNLYP